MALTKVDRELGRTLKGPRFIPSFVQRDRMKRDKLSSKNHKGMKSKGDARWRSGLLEAAFMTICLHKKISFHMKYSFIIKKNSSPIHSQYLRMELLLAQQAGSAAGETRLGEAGS